MARAAQWGGRVALAIAAAAPVLAIAVLGWWNRFVADDFSMASRLQTMGVLGAWKDQLTVLNGRFAGYFISDVLALAGPRGAWIATALAMVALVAAVYLAIPRDGEGRWSPRRAVAALLLASAVVVSTPVPDQAFLWVAGIGMVTASLIAAAFAAAFAIRAAATTGRARVAWFAATFVAALVASGAYESTAFVVIVAGAVAAVAIGWRRRWSFAAAVTIAAGAAAGLLVVAAIPGSRARRTYFPYGKPVPEAVETGMRSAGNLALEALGTRALWLAFLAGVLCVAPAVTRGRVLRWLAAAVAGSVLAVGSMMAFSVWVFGTAPPPRTMGVPAAAFVTAAFLAGWLVPTPARWVPAIAVVTCGLAAYVSLPFLDLVPERRAWAADWDRRETLLVRGSPDDVVSVPQLWAPEGLADFDTDASYWVNDAAARYYRVRQVVGVPPEDYPGCWASITRNGSTSCGSSSTSTITP